MGKIADKIKSIKDVFIRKNDNYDKLIAKNKISIKKFQNIIEKSKKEIVPKIIHDYNSSTNEMKRNSIREAMMDVCSQIMSLENAIEKLKLENVDYQLKLINEDDFTNKIALLNEKYLAENDNLKAIDYQIETMQKVDGNIEAFKIIRSNKERVVTMNKNFCDKLQNKLLQQAQKEVLMLELQQCKSYINTLNIMHGANSVFFTSDKMNEMMEYKFLMSAVDRKLDELKKEHKKLIDQANDLLDYVETIDEEIENFKDKQGMDEALDNVNEIRDKKSDEAKNIILLIRRNEAKRKEWNLYKDFYTNMGETVSDKDFRNMVNEYVDSQVGDKIKDADKLIEIGTMESLTKAKDLYDKISSIKEQAAYLKTEFLCDLDTVVAIDSYNKNRINNNASFDD